LTTDLIDLIEGKLRNEWSPEQISGWLREYRSTLISHETIYKHIWSDKRNGRELFKNLRRTCKKYQSRCKEKQAGRGYIKDRVSIDKRPQVVDDKGRIGDWEIDLVIGKGHGRALVTIFEKKTSFTVTKRVFDKSAQTVTAATIELLAPFKEAVLTITADNGKEFAYHKALTQALECDVFFADPYCSWQRGLNENTNGLLRQYWPRATDFKKVSDLEVTDVLVRLNSRPRKKLTFKTPVQLMDKHIAALAA
jgi:IS30 family transposase